MARYTKNTVDYFPHIVKGGRALFVLESRYGNNGYAFQFKVYETLCESDGLFFDFKDTVTKEIFLAKTRVSEADAIAMMTVLARLNNIDADLWEGKRVVWSQDLVNNLTEVWRRRSTPMPERPDLTTETPKIIYDGINGIYDGINPEKGPKTALIDGKNGQSKVKKRKGEGEVFSLNDNHNNNGIESDKDKSDAAAPPPGSGRPAPLSASPASSPSPEGSGAAPDKRDTTKKEKFPEADILKVAAAYCQAKHVEFCNAIAKSSYLRSKAVFYDAKDFLALNGGDVERACQAIADFAEGYEDDGKSDWTWKYIFQDWSKPVSNGKTWDELRREYELEQSKEKA